MWGQTGGATKRAAFLATVAAAVGASASTAAGPTSTTIFPVPPTSSAQAGRLEAARWSLPAGFSVAGTAHGNETLQVCVGPHCVADRLPEISVVLTGPNAGNSIVFVIARTHAQTTVIRRTLRKPAGLSAKGSLSGFPGSSLLTGTTSAVGIDTSGDVVIEAVAVADSLAGAVDAVRVMLTAALAHVRAA